MEFTGPIQDRTISIRSKYNLKLPDTAIAATAAFLGVKLLTADKKFAKLVDELSVVLIER